MFLSPFCEFWSFRAWNCCHWEVAVLLVSCILSRFQSGYLPEHHIYVHLWSVLAQKAKRATRIEFVLNLDDTWKYCHMSCKWEKRASIAILRYVGLFVNNVSIRQIFHSQFSFMHLLCSWKCSSWHFPSPSTLKEWTWHNMLSSDVY